MSGRRFADLVDDVVCHELVGDEEEREGNGDEREEAVADQDLQFEFSSGREDDEQTRELRLSKLQGAVVLMPANCEEERSSSTSSVLCEHLDRVDADLRGHNSAEVLKTCRSSSDSLELELLLTRRVDARTFGTSLEVRTTGMAANIPTAGPITASPNMYKIWRTHQARRGEVKGTGAGADSKQGRGSSWRGGDNRAASGDRRKPRHPVNPPPPPPPPPPRPRPPPPRHPVNQPPRPPRPPPPRHPVNQPPRPPRPPPPRPPRPPPPRPLSRSPLPLLSLSYLQQCRHPEQPSERPAAHRRLVYVRHTQPRYPLHNMGIEEASCTCLPS
eukprot:765522-Hanusia_phi.AAC.2